MDVIAWVVLAVDVVLLAALISVWGSNPERHEDDGDY